MNQAQAAQLKMKQAFLARRARMAQGWPMQGTVRRPSPFPEGGRARLEEVIQPQYDTEAITAGNGEVNYFQRPLGQSAVAGFQKTLRDTNMRTAGQLPRPQVFVITGIRVIPSLVSGDTGAVPAPVNPDFSDYLGTIKAILYESVFTLRIGTKDYLQIPTFRLPGNVGIDATGWAQRTATAAEAAETDIYYSLWPEGEYFSTLPGRLRLPSLQGFYATIGFPRAAVNSIITGGIKVTVALDGIHGREVQ
jgi:hypothetical protein